MGRKLTKKQAKEFARIQSGILIYNVSGTEFEDSDIGETEREMCYEFMEKQHNKLLREGEYGLSTTQMILNYVREHF